MIIRISILRIVLPWLLGNFFGHNQPHNWGPPVGYSIWILTKWGTPCVYIKIKNNLRLMGLCTYNNSNSMEFIWVGIRILSKCLESIFVIQLQASKSRTPSENNIFYWSQAANTTFCPYIYMKGFWGLYTVFAYSTP